MDMPDSQINLILASASPRRIELLSRFSLPFMTVPSNYKEEIPDMPYEEAVVYLARCKAEEVASRYEGLILAADTAVIIDGMILGKPKDRSSAKDMIMKLSGCCHQVLTGVVLLDTATQRSSQAVDVTSVWFRRLDEAEIERYLDHAEYTDKAGAYAAQGIAAAFITRIEGCYHNVIGLPLHLVDSMLHAYGISLF